MWVFLLAITAISAAQDSGQMPSAQGNTGVIYAKPEDVASNIPLKQILSIGEHFTKPENKVRLQLPTPESQYAWQNFSKFYPTAQVSRRGKVSELPYAIQPSIGDVSYQNSKGESISVNGHFERFPIDAMVVVKDGRIVYERY